MRGPSAARFLGAREHAVASLERGVPLALDEAQARVFTEGNWVTANAQRSLSKNNSLQAERKAATFAKNPQVLVLARNAAKEAVRQNLAIPLQVAGYENAKVTVRFEGEPG